MFIGKNIDIVKKKNGSIVFNYKTLTLSTTTDDELLNNELDKLYQKMARCQESTREKQVATLITDYVEFPRIATKIADSNIDVSVREANVELGLEGLIKFFSEFQFEPNFRFVNTLIHRLKVNKSEATKYVVNYFSLIDSPYKDEVQAKIKSDEFKDILFHLNSVTPQNKINTRFKLYYGSQGTGKTYKAQEESDGRCIVCNSSMLPSDLMEDFAFSDGKPGFNPSLLWTCMENGTKLVLDEINLLPFDSLRFLQGILDGKKEFNYKSKTVHIKDGFEIIGTMNLTIGGLTYGLPEPLVDRCEEMTQFKLTAEDLKRAF